MQYAKNTEDNNIAATGYILLTNLPSNIPQYITVLYIKMLLTNAVFNAAKAGEGISGSLSLSILIDSLRTILKNGNTNLDTLLCISERIKVSLDILVY